MSKDPHPLLTNRVANLVVEHDEIGAALESILEHGVTPERTKKVEVLLAIIEDKYPPQIYGVYAHIYDATISYESIHSRPTL